MKYIIHAELEINDERYAELVKYLQDHDIYWSEEEIDEIKLPEGSESFSKLKHLKYFLGQLLLVVQKR